MRQCGDNHTGDRLIPYAWLLKDGKFMLYEFLFSPLGKDQAVDLAMLKAFLDEYATTVVKVGLEGVAALRLFPHAGYAGRLELTEGRANINFTPDQFSAAGAADPMETQWFFDPE
ncbi:MAG: hypothetical protein MMC33_009067 [Icmadophila ericetorum]|nr:hypothetical protein [Icmadophila ericetorum]